MKGVLDALGKLLGLDLPYQWLRGVEHEGQGLLVEQKRLDGLQMQLHLVKRTYKQGIGAMYTWCKTVTQWLTNSTRKLKQRFGGARENIYKSQPQCIMSSYFTQLYCGNINASICSCSLNIIQTPGEIHSHCSSIITKI